MISILSQAVAILFYFIIYFSFFAILPWNYTVYIVPTVAILFYFSLF